MNPFSNFSKIFQVTIFTILTVIIIASLYLNFFKKQPAINIRGGESVVTQIRSLNRYETAEFTIEKIIEAGSNEGNAFNRVLFGDKILLIANGNVSAGFDFSKIQNNDIEVNGDTVRLTLPPPQILSSRLDNEKTRVYDRRQGFLTQGNKDLESEARLSAENSIRTAACQEGILNNATDNARTQLTALIKAFGFTTVIISIPPGSC